MNQGHSGLSGQLNNDIEAGTNTGVAQVLHSYYNIDHSGLRKSMMVESFDKHRVFKYNLNAF